MKTIRTICLSFGALTLIGLCLTCASGKLAGCCLSELCLATMSSTTLRAAQGVE